MDEDRNKMQKILAEDRGKMESAVKDAAREIAEEVRKIAVNLATAPPHRRSPTDEPYCNTCGKFGHTPAMCPYRTAPINAIEQTSVQPQQYVFPI